MRDPWRLSAIAVVFIVLLRLAIGWQFVYEGMWKLNTFSTAKPWTSAGYLRAAKGPLRNVFRDMTGDPDDLHWLDYGVVAARLDSFRDRFAGHYPDLDDRQLMQLNELLDGPTKFSAPLPKLPDGIKIDGNLAKIISYDSKTKRLVVDGKKHLLPKEKLELQKQAAAIKHPDADAARFLKALDQVYKQSSKLSYKERLKVLLDIDPERVGLVYRDEKTKEIVEQRKGKITEYKELLARYQEMLPRARQAFELKHLDAQWDEIQKLRSELVNPVRTIESDFKQQATKLLDDKQLENLTGRGPVPDPPNRQRRIDLMTIWCLIGFGCLLMMGFFSRIAAIGAAGLLLMFYLVMPPWPGIEELVESGPEHSFIINKNLIEVIALLGIACMPTGQWFGLDRLMWAAFGRSNKAARQPASSSNDSPAGTIGRPRQMDETRKDPSTVTGR